MGIIWIKNLQLEYTPPSCVIEKLTGTTNEDLVEKMRGICCGDDSLFSDICIGYHPSFIPSSAE